MEADHETEALLKIASGEAIDEAAWLELRPLLLARLDKIAHNDFPVPRLPPSRLRSMTTTIPSTATATATATTTAKTSTTETDQHTTDGDQVSSSNLSSAPTVSEKAPQQANKDDETTGDAAPGELPTQINDMLLSIKKHLETFKSHPPHTIQRLAELILRPKAQYRALAPYLHAVDRVVRVSSATNTYPLPSAVFDMSKLGQNGEDARDADAAAHVAWSNPTVAALGTDESLGGALLTPIPWLTRRSPEENNDGDGDDNGETTAMPPAALTTQAAGGAQIHSEATETIDGPNGAGSIETVSVSVNGIPSTGHHTRGVTQGELLRQEQRAGVVPVSQLAVVDPPRRCLAVAGPEPQQQDSDVVGQTDDDNDDDQVPHARGPDDIGIADTGPQDSTASYVRQDGSVSMQHIDVEAALGRKDGPEQQSAPSGPAVPHGDDASSASSTESTATKREAEQDLGGDHKKMKKDGTTPPAGGEGDDDRTSASGAAVEEGG
ncbi:hypothetical protein E4U53_001876 [Claviceps sorghi]|nr:hypothetical protein E4U53_001876 [Claviceps sorghi]